MSTLDIASCVTCPMKKYSLFSQLRKKELAVLDKNRVVIRYKKRETIFKAGTRPLGLLCLNKGKVKIFKEGSKGKELIVRLAKAVEFIGLSPLLSEENYHSTAVALEDSVICVIDKEDFCYVIQKNNNFAFRLIKFLAHQIGVSDNRLLTLTQKQLRGRLAETLLMLKDTYGILEDQSTINAFLSREDIANVSNMTTSNAIRMLSEFKREKLIALNGRKIKILKQAELEKIVKLE